MTGTPSTGRRRINVAKTATVESNSTTDETGFDDQPREPRLTRISRRAHEIYEARGGEHGKDMDDWLQAEREIDAEPDV